MSHILQCDYCGEVIERDELSVTLNANGYLPSDNARGRDLDQGWVGHYHSGRAHRHDDDSSCYRRMRDAISLVHSWAPTLESIETASAQSIAHRRRRHTRREEA